MAQSFRVYQLATLANGSVSLLTDYGQLIIRRHRSKDYSSATLHPKDHPAVPLVYIADGPFHFFGRNDLDSLLQYEGDSIGGRSMAF